jgi:hypothetical protein
MELKLHTSASPKQQLFWHNWESDILAQSRNLPIFIKLKFHYHVHYCSPVDPTLNNRSTPSQPVSSTTYLHTTFRIRIFLQTGPFPSSFPTEIFSNPFIYMFRPSLLLYLIILIICAFLWAQRLTSAQETWTPFPVEKNKNILVTTFR